MAKKKNPVMELAKKIQKPGEKWTDAVRRASKEFKEKSQKTEKKSKEDKPADAPKAETRGRKKGSKNKPKENEPVVADTIVDAKKPGEIYEFPTSPPAPPVILNPIPTPPPSAPVVAKKPVVVQADFPSFVASQEATILGRTWKSEHLIKTFVEQLFDCPAYHQLEVIHTTSSRQIAFSIDGVRFPREGFFSIIR